MQQLRFLHPPQGRNQDGDDGFCTAIPEGILLVILGEGRTHQHMRDSGHILVTLDAGKRVVAQALAWVLEVEHLESIPLALQIAAGLAVELAAIVRDDQGAIGQMEDVRDDIAAGFAGPAGGDDGQMGKTVLGVQAVFVAVEDQAAVALGEIELNLPVILKRCSRCFVSQ